MGLKNTIFLVFVVVLMAKEALGAQHVVGGSQGWDQSTNFNSWVSGETFKVGDQLVFKYSPLHSVVELGGDSAYKNCDLSSPVTTMSTGNDVVKLDKPGTRYFTCGTAGHCNGGMKVKITTVAGNTSSTPTSSSSSPSSSSSSPASTSSASLSHGIVSFVPVPALLVASVLSLFLMVWD